MLQVSVGTLLAFTIVAVSILILRYVPPDEVPLPPSMRESFRLNQECDAEKDRDLLGDGNCNISQTKDVIVLVESMKDPLIEKRQHRGTQNCPQVFILLHCPATDTFYFSLLIRTSFHVNSLGKMDETKRRKIAAFSIGSVCVGVLILTASASVTWLPL